MPPHTRLNGRRKESPRPGAPPGAVRVGTAGWSYEDWRGVVYPPTRPRGFNPLSYVSRFFDCVEINSTFYRIPSPKTTEGWARRVSGKESFRFTVKLHRSFTHEADRSLPGEARAFREATAPLAGRGILGAVLAQFPWSFKNTPENRAYLGKLFDLFEGVPRVIEVRHASWNVPGFYDFLSERDIGFCNIDQPLFRGSMGPSSRGTSPVGYFRLHGQNYGNWFREGAGRDARYDYLYSLEELGAWAERIRSLIERLPESYVIMNNHYRGKAACNALEMKALLSGAPVPCPPPLVEEYPRLRRICAPAPGQGDLFSSGG